MIVIAMAAFVLAERYIRGALSIVKKFFFYALCCCFCNKNNRVSADLEKKAEIYGDYD